MKMRKLNVMVGLLALWLGQAAAWAAPTASPVGEVTFAIGVARLIEADGRTVPVARGMPVRVADRIETSEGGHVHVRFVDGAFVSVRPVSRLLIETYRYDPANPKDSAIRLQLEEGGARAITGKGGEAARERFRLNTPLAAIGVRGTDFTVATDTERVRVAVQSGAVVVAPLGGACRPDAFGPCATDAARILSADMNGMMLEVQRQQNVPRLIPIVGNEIARHTPPPAGEPAGAPARPAEASVESRAVLAVGTLPTPIAALPVAPAEPPPVVPPAVLPPPVVVAPPEPEVVPPLPATLVWGRWAWVPPQPGDTLPVSYAEAAQGRRVTVGNGSYGLFRPETAAPFVMPVQLGRVDFTLRDAEARFVQGAQTSMAQVGNGSLTVDFAASRYATSLALSHPQGGNALLQSSGSIRDDGIFAVINGEGRVAGALSADGREAGYFFERNVNNGQFTGITRWMR